MMLDTDSSQRDRRCAAFLIFLFYTAETPTSYLTRVLGFSTTPFFSNSPFFPFSFFLFPFPFFSFPSSSCSFFLLLFPFEGGPCHFSFWEPEISPIYPAQNPQGPVCVLWKGVPAIFHFGNRESSPKDPAQKPQNPGSYFMLSGAPAIFHFGNRKSPPEDPAQKPQSPWLCFGVVATSIMESDWDRGEGIRGFA